MGVTTSFPTGGAEGIRPKLQSDKSSMLGHLLHGFSHHPDVIVNKGPFTDAEYERLCDIFRHFASSSCTSGQGGGKKGGRKGKQAVRMTKEGFLELFGVRSEENWAPALFDVFKEMGRAAAAASAVASAVADAYGEEDQTEAVKEKEEEDEEEGRLEASLSFDEFFQGVSGCTRASDRSILQMVFHVMCLLGEEGEGGEGGKDEGAAEGAVSNGAPLLSYTCLKEVIRLAYQCHLLSSPAPVVPPSGPPSSASSTSTSPRPPTSPTPPTPTPTPPTHVLTFDTTLFHHPLIRDHNIPPPTSSFHPAMPSLPSFASSLTSSPSEFSITEEEEPAVSFDEFYAWATESFPLLYQPFAAFMYSRLFANCEMGVPPLPLPPSLRLALPELLSRSYILSSEHSLFGLALASPYLQGAWTRLYTSEENGLSFNRICHHILGYRGPTVLLLRDTTGAVFGFFTNDMWKESNSFFGSSECFLFRLSPSFVEIRPKASGVHGQGGAKHYMYLNLKGFSLPHGLGVGGSIDGGFRLWIPESLDGCVAGTRDGTFEWGPLGGGGGRGMDGGREGEFDMEGLEVWGVGGEERIGAAVSAQGHARDLRAEIIAKARKVDKSKFLDNEFDKEFLLGKTFGHGKREQMGRD